MSWNRDVSVTISYYQTVSKVICKKKTDPSTSDVCVIRQPVMGQSWKKMTCFHLLMLSSSGNGSRVSNKKWCFHLLMLSSSGNRWRGSDEKWCFRLLMLSSSGKGSMCSNEKWCFRLLMLPSSGNGSRGQWWKMMFPSTDALFIRQRVKGAVMKNDVSIYWCSLHQATGEGAVMKNDVSVYLCCLHQARGQCVVMKNVVSVYWCSLHQATGQGGNNKKWCFRLLMLSSSGNGSRGQ